MAHQGKLLADYLRSEGYEVTELPRPFEIDLALLSQYAIVIRAGETGNYVASELNAYQTYVSQGGRLLLLHDHFQNKAADYLSPVFGLEYAGTTRDTMSMEFLSHPITDGVGAVNYLFGSELVQFPQSATIIANLAAGSYLDLKNNSQLDGGEPLAPAVMGVMMFGSGRIVFAGDTNFLLNVPQPLTANILSWLQEEGSVANPVPGLTVSSLLAIAGLLAFVVLRRLRRHRSLGWTDYDGEHYRRPSRQGVLIS